MRIQRISDFQAQIDFSPSGKNFEAYYLRFQQSNLGKIHSAIPWEGLVKTFKLKSGKKGPTAIFSPKGKLALMFLKNYAGCSDKRLIEQLNSNIDYQFFCDIYLGAEDYLTNFKIVSDIRCELAANLSINKAQKELAKHWKEWITNKDCMVVDATCYESEVRYPTDQKLLWECVDWCYGQLKVLCKYLMEKLPRTKYLKWKERYYHYSRKKKRRKTETKVLTRSLLKLLKKLMGCLGLLKQKHEVEMPGRYYKRISTIKRIYAQQQALFSEGKKPEGRIVSIGKSYIRPIVRGKEVKKVEFGAKVNKVQVDGINFIENISFENFNDGTRFTSSIRMVKGLLGSKVKVVGADKIYGTNANRKYATSHKIRTDFVRKGRASKHENHRKQLAAMITKERASRLEGSFGKEKEHYYLKKIKARTPKTEILWIFFGIHVANALEIGRRMPCAGEVGKAA